MVAGLLYLFRKIYTEVVSALPVNGGYVHAVQQLSVRQLRTLCCTDIIVMCVRAERTLERSVRVL